MNDVAAPRDEDATSPSSSTVHRIAIVGSGPRGMGVLERIGARLSEGRHRGPVEIYLIDADTVGCGRVWRPDQPDWFVMNTVAGEVTMFSGPPDGGPVRPGAGPSLAQWWATLDPSSAGPDAYAPRALHGRYMRMVLDAVERSLPADVRLFRVTDRVVDLQRTSAGYRLTMAAGAPLIVDRVVLTTGHTLPALTGRERRLSEFAAERPHLRYIRGDSASDMPLDAIPADATVGIIGIGLSFYDVMFALTIGRNGKFLESGEDDVVYQPSGDEPRLVAGSRSGMPIPARGRNQKSASFSYAPVLFTPERIRRDAGADALDFRADVLPWLLAEMDLVYHGTMVRVRLGEAGEAAFRADVAAAAEAGLPDVRAVAAKYGLGDRARPSFDDLVRPFAHRTFADPESFRRALVQEMRRDLERADRGNYADPLKAALDVIRDTRWVVRLLVDFGGLRADSHQRDFIEWFSPGSAFLAAGPPRYRVRYALALIEAGLLRVVGPESRFFGDPHRDRFVAESPQVDGSRIDLDVLVDARIPSPAVTRDDSPLSRRLLGRGIWSEFVNQGGAGRFHTGGVAVTRAPFHPIGRDGEPDTGICVLGVPTEHTRWVTLVGSGRPGPWNEFTRDADAIAEHALTR